MNIMWKSRRQPLRAEGAAKHKLLLSQSIFHLHVPKTAGTTVRLVVEDNLDGGELQDSIMDRELAVLLIGRSVLPELDRFSFLSGHFPLSFRQMLKPPIVTICSIRDPVELIISYFYHQQHAGLIPEDVSIEQFLASEAASTVMNLQSRFMANMGMPEFPANRLAYSDSVSQGRLDQLMDLHSTDNLRDTAMQNAGAIDAVIDAGDLWTGMQALCDRFGWMLPPNLPWHNAAPHQKPPVTEEVRRTIGSMCTIDNELYQTMAAKRTVVTDKHDPAAHICDEHHPFVVSFDEALQGSGWHMRESDQSWGWSRWSTNHSVLHVNLRLLRELTYSLRILLLDCIDPDRLGDVRLDVGGIEAIFHYHREDTVWRGSAALSIGRSDVQVRQIALKVPGAVRLSDRGVSRDNRLLGCRVKSLMIIA